MATKTSQRIGIWVIAVVMFIGTLGAFFLPILISKNTEKDTLARQKAIAELQKQQSASVEPLDGYAADAFDPSAVTDLKVEELKLGDGKPADASSKITVNYFGWTSDGKIFDSSKKSGTTSPIDLSLDGVIKGWTQGLTGAKAGSVRKLTIPSALAYGEAGSPPTIGANQPLKFIVEITKVN